MKNVLKWRFFHYTWLLKSLTKFVLWIESQSDLEADWCMNSDTYTIVTAITLNHERMIVIWCMYAYYTMALTNIQKAGKIRISWIFRKKKTIFCKRRKKHYATNILKDSKCVLRWTRCFFFNFRESNFVIIYLNNKSF